MRVLVTGAGGMLAQAVLPALESAGHSALGLRKGEADVTDARALERAVRGFEPDWLFHLAAFTKVDECESRPEHAYLVNAIGARQAALAAQVVRARVLAVSTDYVFGGDALRPYREYDPPAPRSVYGASKWAGEQAVREVHPRHLIVRTAWLYGHGGANFVDTILAKARAGEHLRVVDDQRGSPTSTSDFARALVKLMEADHYGTYHCTNSGDCSWFDLARYCIEIAGLDTAVERTDSGSFVRPAKRPAYSVLDNQWFEHVSGMRMPDWKDAVKRYLSGGPRVLRGKTAARGEPS